MPGKGFRWFAPVEPFPKLEKTFEKPSRFVCGVPECPDGYVAGEDGKLTVVECETHNARTTHDTVEIVRGEQQVIRVQDQWRQHGTRPPPGKG